MASHIGLLVSFSLGAYLDWRRLAMIATGIEHFLSYANDAPVTPTIVWLTFMSNAANLWLFEANAPSDTQMELAAVEIEFVQVNLSAQRYLPHSSKLIKNAKIEMQNYANGKDSFTTQKGPFLRKHFNKLKIILILFKWMTFYDSKWDAPD